MYEHMNYTFIHTYTRITLGHRTLRISSSRTEYVFGIWNTHPPSASMLHAFAPAKVYVFVIFWLMNDNLSQSCCVVLRPSSYSRCLLNAPQVHGRSTFCHLGTLAPQPYVIPTNSSTCCSRRRNTRTCCLKNDGHIVRHGYIQCATSCRGKGNWRMDNCVCNCRNGSGIINSIG